MSELKAELKSTNAEMDKLKQSGQRGSQAYQDLKSKAGVLKTEINGLTREFRGQDAQVKITARGLLEVGENITTITAGLILATRAIVDFTSEAVTSAAKLQVLRSAFKGTKEDLDLLKKASAGSLTESQIIPLSNKATQIGLKLQEQARLLSYAEDLADKGIGDTSANFDILTRAILTSGRGLNSLGISQKQFNDDLEKTAKSLGVATSKTKDLNGEEEVQLKKLNATQQAFIVKKTLLDNGYIPTLEEVKNKQVDVADKLDAVKVKLEEAKVKAGEFILKGLQPLIDKFLEISPTAVGVVASLGTIGSALGGLLPVIASLKFAMPGLWAAMAVPAPIIATIIALAGALALLESKTGFTPFPSNPVGMNFDMTTKLAMWMGENEVKNKAKEKAEFDKKVSEFTNRVNQKQVNDFQLPEFKIDQSGRLINTGISDNFRKQAEQTFKEKAELDALLASFKNTGSNTGSNGSGTLKNLFQDFIASITNDIETAKLQKEIAELENKKVENDSGRKLQDVEQFNLKKVLQAKYDELEIAKAIYTKESEKNEIIRKQLELLKQIDDLSEVKILNAIDVDKFMKSKLTGKEANSKLKPIQSTSEELSPSKRKEFDFNGAISDAQNIANILNLGSHTFISQLITGLQSAVGLVSNIVSLLNNISSGGGGLFSFFTSLLSFIPGVGGVASIAAKAIPMAGGGSFSGNSPLLVGDNNGRLTPFSELIFPRSSGFVLNNRDLNNLLKGGYKSQSQPNVTVFIRSNVPLKSSYETGKQASEKYNMLTRV